MATTSSNKMPLLVDRPLHEWATIGGTSALSSSTNFNTPSGAGCVQLVDCGGNDGAVIDSMSVVITEAGTTQSSVLVFLSTASSSSQINNDNTVPVASVAIPLSNAAGLRLNVSLPPLSVPVPNLAAPAVTVAAYPSETDKKNTGLYVPSGALLYVGVSAPLTAPTSGTRVIVFAQGGFF